MVVLISILVFIAIAGLIAAPFLAQNQGYIFISFANYTVEMSVVSGVFLLFSICFILWCLTRLLCFIFSLNKRTQHWFKHRGTEKSYASYQAGMFALLSQDFRGAQKAFLQNRKYSPFPVLHTIGAALAAHKQKKPVERDDYFQQAHARFPFASETLTLQHAQLLIEECQFEPALAMLQKLQETRPDCSGSYPLLLEIAVALHDAPTILENITRLRHKNIYSEAQLDNWEITAHQLQLEALQEKQDREASIHYWQKLPRSVRKHRILAQKFYAGLVNSEAFLGFLSDIDHYLAEYASADLLEPLTQTTGKNRSKVMHMLEKRVKKEKNNPLLRTAYAKMLYDDGSLKEAKIQVEQALALGESAQGYLLLGKIMSDMRLTEKAQDYYRAGLELSLQQTPSELLATQSEIAA